MYKTIDNDFLICPYCGYKERVDFETFDSRGLECSEEHECSECGKIFMAHRFVIVHYETDKIVK